jgi:hypothetical protein
MKQTLYILTIVVLSSCGTGMKISKKDFSSIDNKFSATFNNKSQTTKGRYYHSSNPTILDFFELYKINADTVQFRFDMANRLLLTFKDSLGVRTEIFEGNFKKNGYYEIFIRKYKKEIPPFFPFIYGVRDIQRLRIGLTKENELVIDNKWARDGNIFILAGGGSGRYRSYFKQITTRQ